MPQFDIFFLENQVFLTLFGFLLFYILTTKYATVHFKRQDELYFQLDNYKRPSYNFLKINAFTLGDKEFALNLSLLLGKFKKKIPVNKYRFTPTWWHF